VCAPCGRARAVAADGLVCVTVLWPARHHGPAARLSLRSPRRGAVARGGGRQRRANGAGRGGSPVMSESCQLRCRWPHPATSRWFCVVTSYRGVASLASRPFFTRAPAATSPWRSGSWRRPAATRYRSATGFVTVSLCVCACARVGWLRRCCASPASDAGLLRLAACPVRLHGPVGGMLRRPPRRRTVARDGGRQRRGVGAG
jgi:hypothetical protein